MRVLSLGAGVQSTTALLLAFDGSTPSYDHIVFADTHDEPAAAALARGEERPRMMQGKFPARAGEATVDLAREEET